MTNQEIAETALARSQEMRKQCETTLRDSLMEGTDPVPPDPKPEDPPLEPIPTDPDADVSKQADGSTRIKKGNKEIWITGDGSHYAVINTKTGKSYRVTVAGQKVPFDCLDETCQSCVDFMEFHPKLVNDCSGGMGANFEICEEFAKADTCCSNPDAFPVNPLVVTPKNGAQDINMNGLEGPIKQTVASMLTPNPNEDGGMVCNNADLDALALSCETQCSVASADGDCYARCVSRVVAVVEFGLLDKICTQATHEGCFSSEVDFGIGGSEGPFGGTPPLPHLGNTKTDSGSRFGTLQGLRVPDKPARSIVPLRKGGTLPVPDKPAGLRPPSGQARLSGRTLHSGSRFGTLQVNPRAGALQVRQPVKRSVPSARISPLGASSTVVRPR